MISDHREFLRHHQSKAGKNNKSTQAQDKSKNPMSDKLSNIHAAEFFSEADTTKEGSCTYAIYLYQVMQKILLTSTPESRELYLSVWEEYRTKHLVKTPLKTRQLHAMLLTPVIQIAGFEILSIIIGIATFFFGSAVFAYTFHGNIDALLTTCTLIMIVTMFIVNKFLKSSRKSAMKFIVTGAEKEQYGEIQ